MSGRALCARPDQSPIEELGGAFVNLSLRLSRLAAARKPSLSQYGGGMTTLALPTTEYEIWLGEFGERWLHTLCVVAGCRAGKLEPDTGKDDRTISNREGEVIRVQVKTTEHPIVTGGEYKYDLGVDAIEMLRTGTTPGFLVLIVVHKTHPEWVRSYSSGSVIHASAYWQRIAGMSAPTNAATQRVSLPRANLLTTVSLLSLFPGGE
jgi:hypothetical protein